MARTSQTGTVTTEQLINTISCSARTLGLCPSIDGEPNDDSESEDHAAQRGRRASRGVEERKCIKDKQSKDADAAKSELLHACRALIASVSGPTETLKNMALIDKHNLISLQVINHYNIASLVPDENGIDTDDLAHKCNLPTEILSRILRQAMTYGVFCEPRSGHVAHTALSREIPRLAPLLAYQLETCLPSTLSLLDWLKQDGGVPPEGDIAAPFQIAHDTEDSWWNYAEKRPDLNQNYGKYMALITKGGPHDVSHVVSGFAWDKLGKALVIDIGGADGLVGSAIASANPNLTVLVQDNAGLQESFDKNIPSPLRNRVIFAAHSFFNPQEVTGSYADVFLLRHILHDWNDESGVKILRHITGCMKEGARVVVAEQILGPPGTLDAGTERVMRALDMQMMVQFGGKERTLDDWRGLFQMADSRLELVACVQPEGSADSLLELRLNHALEE